MANTGVFDDASQTLTNKTIDADNNTVSNLALGSEVTGSAFDLSDFPADPDADKFLMWDDDPGELVWADAGAGSGATTALDNLASVAINTDLISDTNDTDSLGSTGIRWKKLWATDVESTNMPTVSGTAILSSLTAPQFTTIELGHATDTTLARVSAGVASIEGKNIYLAGGTDVAVADGGTGKSSWTQYLIPYADTTTSFSQIAIGNSGQVLTSNGAGSAPTFQDASGGAWTDLYTTANKSHTSSTLSDITGLTFAFAANSVYRIRIQLLSYVEATEDIKFGLSTGAAGVDMIISSYMTSGNGFTTATGGFRDATATNHNFSNNYSTTVYGRTVWDIYLDTGASTGTFAVQSAAIAYTGNESTVLAGSTLEYIKVA